MADTPEIAFLFPSGGMNGAGVSTRLQSNQWRRSSNVTLVDELPTTRFGMIAHKLTGEEVEFFSGNNIQGALFFDPSAGQDGLNFQTANPGILVACGGKKFCIYILGTGAQTVADVKDISFGSQTPAKYHLVWWGAAEYFAFANDGNSDCFIFDASTVTGFFSDGYDTLDKPSSMIPNGATCTLYIHARVSAVVNGKIILYGDSLHKSSLTSARNLIESTEQVYYDTGTFFAPPSSMGYVTAAVAIVTGDTNNGQGEGCYHTLSGIFTIDTNQIRSEWPTKAVVRTFLRSPGAVGPYAVAAIDRDQIYRNLHGIVALRSARAQVSIDGDPDSPYSEPVRTFLKADEPQWLRFCSLVIWQRQQRMLCTVDPMMDGRWRWHNAVVVRNFKPMPAENSRACWEGLWTLPPKCAGIIQMVVGVCRGEERLFALCLGDDGLNRLAEFREDLTEDVMEDGTRIPIRCQLLSRALAFDAPFSDKAIVRGTLFLRNVIGNFEWGIWLREHGKSKFVYWRSGKIAVPDAIGELGIEQGERFTRPIPLGNPPKDCATGFAVGRAYELLIRWKGHAQIEAVRIMANGAGDKEDRLEAAKFNFTIADPLSGGYSDYEYSGGQQWSVIPINQ